MKHCSIIESSWLVAACLITLICLAVLGCGGTQTGVQAGTQSNLKKLATLYGRFQSQHRGQPPANEKEFKDFLRSAAGVKEPASASDDPNALLISERDGKPYIVVYGRARGRVGVGSRIVAYEQDGINGKRLVAHSLGSIQEVDQAQLEQLTK